MSHTTTSHAPLLACTLGLGALLAAAPACIEPPNDDGFDVPRGNEEFPLEPLAKVQHCPDEYFESDAEGVMQHICALVVDSKGNPIEEGLRVTIAGKSVDGPEIDWSRELEKGARGVLLDISAPGYVPLVRRVKSSLINQPLVLQRLNQTEFDPQEGSEIVDASGAVIVVKPNSLVTAGGDKPEGEVTFGSFLFSPALQDLPGDMTAINSDDELVYLQSYGTMFLSATDAGGNTLQLAPGAGVTLFVPVDKRTEIQDEKIPLWRFDRRAGMWRSLEGNGVPFQGAAWKQTVLEDLAGPVPGGGVPTSKQGPLVDVANLWDCTSFGTGDPCFPEHCKYVGSDGVTGEFGTLGFVNFDMEKNNPGCVFVDIDELNVPTNEFPVCLRFEIAAAGGPIVREDCMGPSGTVLYNIPANADVDISLLYTYGCPAPTGAGQTVNSGAPWGGVGAPADPANDCNGSIVLPPF